MDGDNEQPRPLHIVKRASSDAAGRRLPASSLSDGHPSHARSPHRTASMAADEGMDSISEEPVDNSGRLLAIPKKRRPLLAHRSVGAGRFDTPAVAAAAAATRRRRNATDNFGDESPEEDVDMDPAMDGDDETGGVIYRTAHRDSLREHRQQTAPGHPAGDLYGSMRSHFQRDLCAEPGYDTGSASPQRPQSTGGSHSSLRGRYFEEEYPGSSMRHPGRIVPEDDGLDNGYPYLRSVYGMRNETAYTTETTHRFGDTSNPPVWDPDPDAAKPPSFRQRPGIPPFSSRTVPHGRLPDHLMYDRTGNLSPPLRHRSYERPLSAANLPVDMAVYAPDPYERAATAIPFDSQRLYQQRPPSGSPGHPAFDHFELDPFARRHPSRPGLPSLPSFPLAPPAPPPEADPQILIPIVSVTPERRTVVGEVNSFWVAIELFAQVTAPMDTIASRSRALADGVRHASTTSISSKDDQDLYRYGYLSDMNIEIHPSPHSEILEVIGKSPSILTLFPGSRRLMVVHVHLDVTPGRSGHAPTGFRPLSHREKSEKLMEDLELQLGATAREYMQVQLTYNHSGFPKFGIGRNLSGRSGGCVAVQTTIETTATAVIMQQNTSSMWSPSPSPASSPLVDIVGKHWGPAAALEMAQRLAASNEMRTLRKSANPLGTWNPKSTANTVDMETRPMTPDGTAGNNDHDEVTPRAASQQLRLSGGNRESTQQGKQDDEQQRQQEDNRQLRADKQAVPGRAATMGRSRGAGLADSRMVSSTTGGRRVSAYQQEAPLLHIQRLPSSPSMDMPLDPASQHSPPAGCLPARIKNTRTVQHEGPRQAIPDAAPRSIKRPVGMDTTNFQRLAHSVSDLTLGSKNAGERERLPSYSRTRNSSRSSMMSKKSGKWSWTGWFS